MQKITYHGPLTASALVRERTSVYHGYTVTVVTATGVINIRDGTSASGTIVDVIPVGTAAGASKSPSFGRAMTNGIFVEFAGGATGTVIIDVAP